MRVYLDTCVLNRLTDPPSSARVATETEASLQLFRLIRLGQIDWLSSEALELELRKNPNPARRKAALDLLAYATDLLRGDARTRARANALQAAGYGALDGFHLAFAEQAKADTLLTTDDRFLGLARRNAGEPRAGIANPVEWLRSANLWRPLKI